VTALTYPDDMQILYSYDDLNRVTEVKRYVDGSNDEILLDNTQYDTETLLTQFDYGNDLQATFSYDSRDRLSTIDVKNGETSFLDLDYTYDDNGNITQLVNGWRDTDSDWNSDTETYSYDGLDRLTSASCNSWSHTYTYDKAGNITSKDSVTYTINVVNEVTALSDGTSFTYDDNGNRTQKSEGNDTWDYTYDYANRLTNVEENSSTVGEYVYDGEGKRIQVTEDSVTTTYMYSGMNIVYEENSTGEATYIYGPTGRLAKRTTIDEETNVFYYHTDHLGSTRLVTDENKNIVAAVTYHPFGEANAKEGTEEFLFSGKELDSTELYYFGARYYDPEIGRWITRDPLRGKAGSPQSLNRYSYCVNNPVNFIDPVGLVSYSNVVTGVTIRWTKDGQLMITYEYNGETFTLLIDGDDWYLINPDGTKDTLVQDGKVMTDFAAGFLFGFSQPASITLGPIGSQTPPLRDYKEAYNFALSLGLSEDQAKDWANGYLMGYALGDYLSQKENRTYMTIAKSCIRNDAWNDMCHEIMKSLLEGYLIVLPISLPWWVELGMYLRQIRNIFKDAWK
jgi:RHS repeat-associated protein